MSQVNFTLGTPAINDVPEGEQGGLQWRRVVLLVATYAVLCIASFGSRIAWGQIAEARLRVEYRPRVERGMLELERLSPVDRDDVIRRVQDGFAGVSEPGKLLRRRMVLDAFDHEDQSWISVKAEHPSSSGRTVFLDVKNHDGKVQVGTLGAADRWLQEMELDDVTPKWHSIVSAEELDRLVGDATTVVHEGDNLPKEWRNPLWLRSAYLRHSDASPKRSMNELLRAQQILERRPEPGRVRIMSALPQSTDTFASLFELYRMGLHLTDSSDWRKLQGEMSRLQSDLHRRSETFEMNLGGVAVPVRSLAHHRIETATKDAFVKELLYGTNDYVVLIAHFDDEGLHFPDGTTMTTAELGDIKRDTAPDRTLILISCDAGSVNGPVQSAGETALKNNLALGVIAPPRPVSAAEVPGLLRSYLIQHRSINDVFVTNGNFHHIAENVEAPREEMASLAEGWPILSPGDKSDSGCLGLFAFCPKGRVPAPRER